MLKFNLSHATWTAFVTIVVAGITWYSTKNPEYAGLGAALAAALVSGLHEVSPEPKSTSNDDVKP